MPQQNNSKQVSLWLTEAVDDCLRIQAILQCSTKSTLIKEMVVQHANDNDWSVDKLTERYAKHLYTQWDLRWREKSDFRSYMTKSAVDLVEKYKLPIRLSTRIIKLCEEQHKRNQLLSK